MIRSLLVTSITVMTATSAVASSVTLSDSNTDSSVGVNQVLNLGDSSQVYIWVTPDAGQTINGLALDVLSSDLAVLEATSRTIFNPTNAVSQNRWGTPISTGTLGDLLTGTNSVSVSGTQGISEAFAALDGGTVDSTGAFLHAVINFDATALGTTTLTPSNSAPITDTTGQIFPDFFGGTVQVVVPEPSSIALLGIGGLLLARRRRT